MPGTLPAASLLLRHWAGRGQPSQHDASQVLSGKWLYVREADANRVTVALISMMHIEADDFRHKHSETERCELLQSPEACC